MNINLYLASRSLVSVVGNPLIFISAITALLLFACCVIPPVKKYVKMLSLILLAELSMCFLLISFFHFRIYQSVKIDDFQSSISAAIPPWIESEKLFFWGLLIQLIIVIKKFKNELFLHTLLAVNSLFILFIAVFSNPFSPLLPGFHNEISEFFKNVNSGNSTYVAAAYEQMEGKIRYFYNSAYMWLHPPLLFLSYSVFGISFIGCIFMLLNKGERTFEKAAYNFGKFGYLMLTAGILLGYPWAISAWKNESWWWSPKINMSIMTWLFYTAYLHSRLYLQKKGMWNTSAILGIAAFLFLILTYISTYTIPGTHSYG